MEFILPFTKTPSAVAMQLVNYSPVGIVKTIVQNIGKGKFDQRLFAQGIGRGLTGLGVLYIGAELFNKGMMNLSYPTTEREQKLWELEGRKAGTVKIGDKYRSVQILGPIGQALLIGGHFARGLKETGSITDALIQSGGGALKSFTEQTFLQGIKQVVDSLNDPENKAKTFVSNLIGSSVPTLIGDIARSIDGIERRTPGVMDRLYSRVPGLREVLEPQVTTMGDEIKTVGPIESAIDPSRPSEVKSDKITRELDRLTRAGFPSTPTMLGNKNGYKSLSDSENTNLWKMSGSYKRQAVEFLLNNATYKSYDAEKQSKMMADYIDRANVEARAKVIYSAVEDLSPEERFAKLTQMKEDKLLTQQVYARYKSLSR